MNYRRWFGLTTLQCREQQVSRLFAYFSALRQWHRRKLKMKAWESWKENKSRKLIRKWKRTLSNWQSLKLLKTLRSIKRDKGLERQDGGPKGHQNWRSCVEKEEKLGEPRKTSWVLRGTLHCQGNRHARGFLLNGANWRRVAVFVECWQPEKVLPVKTPVVARCNI
jgi:hypothetical protein